MENHIFALDIGTRSVTGVILRKEGEHFKLIDYCMKEHQDRAMHDGQIHNVMHVSNVITDVKQTLEKKHGKLEQVCVAAAGRSLKTIRASYEIELNHTPLTNIETIKHLELSAVNQAQKQLVTDSQANDQTNYYCVGYSVLYYQLDNERIGSLIDQVGGKASAHIIATFLPKVVIDSLFAALQRAQLKMAALTLEPIAAIHVLIPESMRRLNVVLVDIGAGTSDIAITNQGTIVAYGMVPIAGDEITEAISDHYLLDFPIAEKTKRKVVNEGEATVSDILGFDTTVTYEEVVQHIKPQIDYLAGAIAEEIIRLNSKAPKAVMLIGGGSLTPEITSNLANKLQLPENRVAIRKIDALKHLINIEDLPNGPDYVTPIGIAISAKENPIHYITVHVNDQVVRLFESKHLTVGDALIQAGIDINKMYGKPGLAYFITMNERKITLPGKYGEPPEIVRNNEKAVVGDSIQDGDRITITKGADGTEPNITIEELIGDVPPIHVVYNSDTYVLTPTFTVNQQPVAKTYKIKDKDAIIMKQPRTIRDFLMLTSTEIASVEKQFIISVNKKNVHLQANDTKIYVNDKQVTLDHVLNNYDKIKIISGEKPTIENVLNQLNKQYWKTADVFFNGKKITLKDKNFLITRQHVEIKENDIIQPDDRLEIKELHKPFIFQDIFRFVDLDVKEMKGNYRLRKNEEPTSFDDEIMSGDHLSIEWDL